MRVNIKSGSFLVTSQLFFCYFWSIYSGFFHKLSYNIYLQAFLQPGKTIWYFDYIPDYTQCFEHTVRKGGETRSIDK